MRRARNFQIRPSLNTQFGSFSGLDGKYLSFAGLSRMLGGTGLTEPKCPEIGDASYNHRVITKSVLDKCAALIRSPVKDNWKHGVYSLLGLTCCQDDSSTCRESFPTTLEAMTGLPLDKASLLRSF